MAKFYNITRTRLSATTTNGRAVSFSSRKWVEVVREEEASASIIALVQKGFLKRMADPVKPVPPQEPPKAAPKKRRAKAKAPVIVEPLSAKMEPDPEPEIAEPEVTSEAVASADLEPDQEVPSQADESDQVVVAKKRRRRRK